MPTIPEADELVRRLAEHGADTSALDRVAAFAEVCRATIRPGEVLVAQGSPPAFVYVPTAPGLVVRPDGGYAPSPLPPWVPVGTTGVIRRAERNSEIVAERDRRRDRDPRRALRPGVAPPAARRRAPGATPGPAGTGMTMTTIERVVALHRVPMFADVPGRTLAALAQRAHEVSRRHRRAPSSSRARWRTTCSRSSRVASACTGATGRSRSLGAGATVGELAALVPEPRSASVTALEPTMLLRIDKPLLDELLADRPALASGIIEALVAMVRERTRAEADRRPRDRPAGADRAAVRWLTSQSLVFGAMAALLGIVANAMFLDAYGSAWLPVTYIAIGVVGFVVSGAVARSAQRFDLVADRRGGAGRSRGPHRRRVAHRRGRRRGVGVRAAAGAVPDPDPARVRVHRRPGRPAAGHLGDQAQLPAHHGGVSGRCVAGGVLGGWLVSVTGRTDALLLATAAAQATFALLVLATERRHPAELAAGGRSSDDDRAPARRRRSPGRPSTRWLLRSRFVTLILAYQVLSALGSQLSDFLVLDRATAQYPATADLARFMAGYTAIMNVVAIAFLFVLAGPLLQRFGLRLGVVANPFVVTILAVGMLVCSR